MSAHTPGPWDWFESGGRPYLATPDRGRLYVMGFARLGMQGATPRFAVWPGIEAGEERGRRGGVMEDSITLLDGTMHPDARLIAASPDLLNALLLLKERGHTQATWETAERAIAAATGAA